VFTTTETPAERAAARPSTPLFGLWVCTIVGRSRRKDVAELRKGARVAAG
jgi:hypothetical protein